jgi:hypothetical protein
MRRLGEGIGDALAGSRVDAAGGGAQALLSRTGSRRRGGGNGAPRRASPHAGTERAARARLCASRREVSRAWPQSRGSQLAGTRSGAQPGERVLDLCAAPAGRRRSSRPRERTSSPSRSTRAGPRARGETQPARRRSPS